MSSVAEILSLVNGNPNKTLDELFLEHLGLGATDATLKELLASYDSLPRDFEPIGTHFSPTVGGTVRIIATFVRGYSKISENIYIRVYEDDNWIKDTFFAGTMLDNTGEYTYSFDINVTGGKKYQLQMECDTYHDIDCNSLRVCGSITDPTLII